MAWHHASDLDHAEWVNGPNRRPAAPLFSVHTRAQITARHGDPQQAPLIHRLRDDLAALNLDQPGDRCAHGVNTARAGCGPCLVREGVL